jgi:hypothetical protein
MQEEQRRLQSIGLIPKVDLWTSCSAEPKDRNPLQGNPTDGAQVRKVADGLREKVKMPQIGRNFHS